MQLDIDPFHLCRKSLNKRSSIIQQRQIQHTMSSAFEITPPAPLLRRAVSSANQNGMRLPSMVWLLPFSSGEDQVCDRFPDCVASAGDIVVECILSGWNIRSRTNSGKGRFE